MLTKRIIPCLDVKNGKVVKGVQFDNHEDVGEITDLAYKYSKDNADELVFYDISASTKNEVVETAWVKKVADKINIPFCVAGGIKNIRVAEAILNLGADKISINTPAIENPKLITELAKEFGSQCVVVGIDSFFKNHQYNVYSKTGDPTTRTKSNKLTYSWIKEVQDRGAGEIVLNCMNQDGVRNGYDIKQLLDARKIARVPLIASGGAGNMDHFYDVFKSCNVDGALAASVFHKNVVKIEPLKSNLLNRGIRVRT